MLHRDDNVHDYGVGIEIYIPREPYVVLVLVLLSHLWYHKKFAEKRLSHDSNSHYHDKVYVDAGEAVRNSIKFIHVCYEHTYSGLN
jgi:hypothetical protein